jgi:hypothetical protein
MRSMTDPERLRELARQLRVPATANRQSIFRRRIASTMARFFSGGQTSHVGSRFQ